MLQLDDETMALLKERDAALRDACWVRVDREHNPVEPTMCIPSTWRPLLREAAAGTIRSLADRLNHELAHGEDLAEEHVPSVEEMHIACAAWIAIKADEDAVPVPLVSFLAAAAVERESTDDDVDLPATLEEADALTTRVALLRELIEFRDERHRLGA